MEYRASLRVATKCSAATYTSLAPFPTMAPSKNLLFILIAAAALAASAWFLSESKPAVAAEGREESVPAETRPGQAEPALVTELTEPEENRSEAVLNAPAEDALAQVAEEASDAAPDSTLRGRIVDEQGFTVAGAEVRVWAGRRVSGEPVATAVSSPAGEFAVGVPGPEFVAAAFHEDMVCVRGLRGSLAAETECVGLELVLARAYDFVGTVVGTEGLPIEGAVLELSDALNTSSSIDATDTEGVRTFGSIAGALAARQVTEANGRFEFAGVPGARASVRVEATGYVGQWFPHIPTNGPATITLERGLVLSGIVLDAEGKPAVGADVRFGPLASNLGVNRSRTTTDETGRFSVGGIAKANPSDPSSVPTFVAALHEGHSVALLQPAALEQGGPENVMRLERAAPLTGRVVDGEGQPVSGARVWLRSEREYERPYVMVGTPPSWESLFREFDEGTDREGRFEFPGRFKGPCSLKIQTREKPRRTMVVEVGADESEVEVVLSDEALDKVVLEGRLVDASNGEPIAEFELFPWSEVEGGGRTARGDDHRCEPNGTFRVAGLDAANLELEFKAEGYAALILPPRTFEEGVHDLGELKMSPSIALRVAVVDEEGEPWTSGSVGFEDAAGKRIKITAGGFSSTGAMLQGKEILFEGLPAMPLTAVVKGQATRWEQAGVDPRAYAGQTLTLIVPRPKLGALQVTFLERSALGDDPNGFLEAWRRAMATRDIDWFMENQNTLMGAFPKKDLTVRVMRDGFPLATGRVTWIAEAGHYRTSAQWERRGTSSEGAPVPDLLWGDLPSGEVQVVVKDESGTEITLDATVGEPGEKVAPLPIVL